MDWTTVFTALFASIVSAWLTASLALRNAKRGSWWERKVEAYERVIAAIEQLHFNANEQLEILIGTSSDSEHSRKEREKSRESERELRRTLNTATLLLNFEVIPVLNGYLSRTDKNPGNPVLTVERDVVASGKCMGRLIQIARRDLGLRPLELERLPGESRIDYFRSRLAMFCREDRSNTA